MIKNHPHKKKWGQNFIQDDNIVKKIIKVIEPDNDDVIIEIGPGQGALTYPLIKKIKHLTAIEIDPLLCNYLEKKHNNNLTIINDDVLNIDFNNLKNHNKIIGNLPYYITSPIIFKILQHQFWEKIVLMVQKEVADRIIAKPKNKTYGRLSVMIQSMATINKKINISRNIFYPKPKVDSTLIELNINKKYNIKNFESFSLIVKKAFGQRRKILRNSLSEIMLDSSCEKFLNKRAEELSVNNYIEISNNI